MPDYVNTDTLALERQPPDRLPWIAAPWVAITRAEYDAAAAIPRVWRKWSGSAVEEMTQAEKDAIAAAEEVAAKASDADEVDQVEGGLPRQIRALINVSNQRDNYLVNRIAELQAALDAMKASTGSVGNLRDAIPSSWLPTATRLLVDARTDFKDTITNGEVDS